MAAIRRRDPRDALPRRSAARLGAYRAPLVGLRR